MVSKRASVVVGVHMTSFESSMETCFFHPSLIFCQRSNSHQR
jgi:hypothetical protein